MAPLITKNFYLRKESLALQWNYKPISANLTNMGKVLASFFLVIGLIVLPGLAFSQKMKLSGTVSDSSKPLSLVTVRIFKKNNPAPLQVTLSKENGTFQLNKPDTGHYILSFTHTGYTEKRIDMAITAQSGDTHLDPVQLSKAIGVLK